MSSYLHKSIHHGICTMNELSSAIDACLYLAHKLDIHIKYRVGDSSALTCELHRYGQIILKEEYKGKFLHIRLANMYVALLDYLHEIDNKERQEREQKAREKAQEERINKMPMWRDRQANNKK